MIKTSALLPTVLTIAGSDPCGGAGIQADLKTMTAIGVYGAAAITCITVQNSLGVSNVMVLSPSLVAEQVGAVLNDHRVTHIKIGMVGSLDIARALAEILQRFEGEVIYDPVLASTTGQRLFDSTNFNGLDCLINQVTVLTPNVDELGQLRRQSISTEEQARDAGMELLANHPRLRCLIIKGGHLEPEQPQICDLFLRRGDKTLCSKRPRLKNMNLHGTGCTFASAFASFHCLFFDDEQAFWRSCTAMESLIQQSAPFHIVKSGANGPLLHHRLR